MTDPIEPIDETEESRGRRAINPWLMQCTPQSDNILLKKDLSVEEVSRLDRTSTAAKAALASTDLASPIDTLRNSVTNTKPLGSAAVTEAAKSAALISSQKVRSPFELASNMGKRPEPEQPFRKALQELDTDTVRILHDLFTEVQNPSTPSPSSNRPRLEPPREEQYEHTRNYLLMILELHESMEEVISDFSTHLDIQTKRDMKELGELREQKIKAIEEHVRAMDSQESWSSFANIARYFTYASTAVLGAALLSSGAGGAAGYFLIASGGLGIVNAAVADLNAWKDVAAFFTKSQEMQLKWAQNVEFTLQLLSIGCGIVGGIGAMRANALQLVNKDAALAKAIPALKWFTAIFTAATYLGKSLAQGKDSAIRAKLETLETQIQMTRLQLQFKDNQALQWIKMAQTITQETAKILASAELSLAN